MLGTFRASLLARLAVPTLLATAALAQSWVQRTPATTPSARNGSANCMAYDPVRGVSLLFGGYQGSLTALADTWEWNGTAWTQRTVVNGPVGRWGHGLVQDTRRGRAVMFGGFVASTGQFSNETWEWDGSAWSQIQVPNAPPPRGYCGMAYDSVLGRTVLFGGYNGANYLGDTWIFDGAAWTQASPVASPSARQGAAMAFDSVRAQAVLFGGVTAAGVLGDTWTFDGTNWAQRSSSSSPSARQSGSMCFDALAGRTLLHGGADATFAINSGETWGWDGQIWTPLTSTGPSPRHGAAMACDLQRGQIVLFGGLGTTALGDTWETPSPGLRTMSTLTMPEVGQQANFQYSYPSGAAGNFYWQILTSHMIGSVAIPVPGFVLIGEARINVFDMILDWTGFLDASGSLVRSVSIPNSPVFSGFAFDVQALDVDLRTNTIFWSRNDAEVRIGQASSGTEFTEVITSTQTTVIYAGQSVAVTIPPNAVSPGSPVVVEVDPTPEPWMSDASYLAAPIETKIYLDPNALQANDDIEVEIPLGSFPLQDFDASNPGILNGSVCLYINDAVSVALPTTVITSYTVTGLLSRRARASIRRGLLSVIRPVMTVATVATGVVVAGAALALYPVSLVVRALRCGANQLPAHGTSLLAFDRNQDNWVAFAGPSSPLGRAAFVVPGIQLLDSQGSVVAGPASTRALGSVVAGARMPYSTSSIGPYLYDQVYCIAYRDSAGVQQVGSVVRAVASAVVAQEFDFIAHSMGGLVVRWAVEIGTAPSWNTATQRISRIVTLATPHEGAPASGVQSVLGTLFASPLQCRYGQHLTDLSAGSNVLSQLAQSQPGVNSTRYYAWAGTRWNNYMELLPNLLPGFSAGSMIAGMYLLSESDGIVPRYSALSSSLLQKGDVRVRDAVYLNHSTIKEDVGFLVGTVVPRLMEDRPGSVPVVDFSASPVSGPTALSVLFINASSSGATAWRWDFNNDGLVDSTSRNPNFTYASPGSYTVRLEADYPPSATYAGGTLTRVRSNYINVGSFVPNPALNMVAIQSGTFAMGSSLPSGFASPVHTVTISRPFWIGKYEVTQASYQAVMGINPSAFQGASYPGALSRPVENVTWDNAVAYCSSLNSTEIAAGRVPSGYRYRLPTEAEWEYCCRAGSGTEWNTGTSLLAAQANFNTLGGQTSVVGSYPLNAWGIADMHGNVWEWCLDSWDGTSNYPSGSVVDPYVRTGGLRGLRGGGWYGAADVCRSAYRSFNFGPTSTSNGTGFRIVLGPVLVP